ncbi:MAG: sporulation protein YunB, partial [Clostridia bacterium]|nr:sporulation protein YunB [Clostridia bacterium]
TLIISASYLYYVKTVLPLVTEMAEAEVKKVAVNVINQGSLKLKEYQAFYSNFYKYDKNTEGEIVLVSANTANINLINVYAQKSIQNSINELKNNKITIPAGAFTGSAWLADKGEGIEINVMPIGAVETKITSYYFNEGINQTLHRLILKITTTIKIIVPVKAKNVTITNEILLAEDIIAGKVPDSYVTGISDDNIYDLLP